MVGWPDHDEISGKEAMVTALVFRNGGVFDGLRHRPGCAVVVRDGRVTSVVGEGELTSAEVPVGAIEIDLAGGLLSPGFVDAHVHPVQGGLERIRCDLSDLRTREEYLRAIGDYALAHPELPWIMGGGWAMPAFPGGTPTAADLDAVIPDRPVFLPNRDHHGAWVNSRALEIAGVGAPPRTRRTAGSSATPRVARRARCMRARWLGGPAHAGHRPGGVLPGAARGPALPALPGRHRVAGRDPRCVRRRRRRLGATCVRRRTETSPATSWVRSGGTAAGARSRSRSWSSAGGGTPTGGCGRPR